MPKFCKNNLHRASPRQPCSFFKGCRALLSSRYMRLCHRFCAKRLQYLFRLNTLKESCVGTGFLGAIMRFALLCRMALVAAALGAISACAPTGPRTPLPAPAVETAPYVIGPGDQLQISVWHNAELSAAVPVRPDERISTPLVSDIVAAGRTPEDLGR